MMMKRYGIVLCAAVLVLLWAVPVPAARTIYGSVKDPFGKPVAGVLIKAFDSDKNKDEYMGQASTDSRGNYRIVYKKKRYDTKIPGTKKQFPDIYVVAYAKIKGRQVKVKQSGVKNDRRHKDDTKIDLKLTGISGMIKDSRGKPAAGFLVRAWDSDDTTFSKNDFMNDTTTDSSGRYFMLYEGKHWDPAPHNVTTWRPDIYLKVLRRVDGDWVKVGQSRKFDDWKHRDHLTINVTVPEDRWVQKYTGFDPNKHGWHFQNRKFHVCFQYMATSICGDWSLCGGMSLSALKRYRSGKAIEPFSGKVKQELKNDQVATLDDGVGTRFVKWTAKPDKPHKVALHTIGHDTKKEWNKLKEAIDRGAPIIMGQIKVGPSNNPNNAFKNHQVLAYGYRYNDGTKQVEIFVYDPNHPYDPNKKNAAELSKVKMNIGIPQNQIKCRQETEKCLHTSDGKINTVKDTVRGFFVISKSSGPRGAKGGSSKSKPPVKQMMR